MGGEKNGAEGGEPSAPNDDRRRPGLGRGRDRGDAQSAGATAGDATGGSTQSETKKKSDKKADVVDADFEVVDENKK